MLQILSDVMFTATLNDRHRSQGLPPQRDPAPSPRWTPPKPVTTGRPY